MLRLIHIQYRHSVDRCTLSIACRRIQYVVSTYHYNQIGLSKIVVHCIHFEQIFVRNVHFSQQYVHMSRHSSRNRMNCEAYFRSVGGKRIEQLLHLLLSLRQSHTIARHDNYPFCVGKYLSHRRFLCGSFFFGRYALRRSYTLFRLRCYRCFRLSLNRSARKNSDQTSVHRFAHDLS